MRHFLRYYIAIIAAFFTIQAFSQTVIYKTIYEAKKKDTLYGIAKNFDITIEELIRANPQMKASDYKLKKGEKVFIPQRKDEPKPQPVQKRPKTQPGQTIRIGVMLPLHDVDGDGKRMVEYYRGILMACDSLRFKGINTDIRSWNVSIDSDIRLALLDDNAKNLDLIFGPLYTKQVKSVADFCNTNNIKLVIPFSTSANDVQTNPQVYQVYQDGNELNNRAIGAFMGKFKDYNTILIDCNDTTSNKGNFTFGVRRQLDAKGIKYQITNLNSSEAQFQKAFSTQKKNIVILNTGRSPELNLAFRKLNELKIANPSIDVSMFGYNEWLQYEGVYRQLYHKYNVFIPSTYYYYKGLSRVAALENNYKKWFGVDTQDRYIPRFALTGYDHAMFFVRGLYDKGSAFEGTANESTYKPLQSPLLFRRTSENGGMQNHAFQLVHYNANGVIETIGY